VAHNVYRDGRIHVCAEMCPTCVFRPGNLMSLHPGRLRDMIEDSKRDESGIVCHETLEQWDGHGTKNATCRGFFDRFPTTPLQLAERLGRITYITPEPQA
jgi:hypothetical protein